MLNKIRIPKLTIVIKVAILASIIAALASIVVGSIIVNGSADIIYENALNRLKYETNIKSLKLVSGISNLSGDAKYLASTPPIQGIPRAIKNGGIDPLDNSDLSTWKNRLATIFSELIRAKPNYLQIRYISFANHGQEIVRVDRQGSAIRRITDDNLQQKGDTPYFKKAIKVNLGDVYLSDITLNREFGKISEPHTPVIRAATPVYFNGKLFGILVINMNFDEIFDTLIKNTPRTHTPYITNEEGYFLAHPDKTATYGFDLETNHTIHTIYSNINLKQTKDLRDTEFTINRDGAVLHIVKAFFDPLNKDRFYAMMLATSYDNLQSASEQLKNTSALVIALLVIISLFVAAILTTRLMRPLQLITVAADNLANGREVTDLPVNSNDEIGELARSFYNMHRQLEDKERELMLSQARVHHANKMASLGEMAAGMAHEINTPMQSINLIAQRVQRQLAKNISSEDIYDSMNNITRSVKNISEIIDSLRNLSRDSTNDDFTETRLCDLISDAVKMTEERFKVNDVHFDISFHDVSENTYFQCQRLQISQVLINLLNNAYDAIQMMDNKWIKINIDKISNKIRFSIIDSGHGIPIEVQKRVFEPMFTTKEIGKGTGLGLSISSDIVTNHNGLLFIDNESANTCFIIELPMVHHDKNKGIIHG